MLAHASRASASKRQRSIASRASLSKRRRFADFAFHIMGNAAD
jgi:hypothetical protein